MRFGIIEYALCRGPSASRSFLSLPTDEDKWSRTNTSIEVDKWQQNYGLNVKLSKSDSSEEYRAGRIVIPEFQREYVWRKSKAPRLIDSLYRGFPISSLLLWQSAEEARHRPFSAPFSALTSPRPSAANASKA